jgi:hypothetical protein
MPMLTTNLWYLTALSNGTPNTPTVTTLNLPLGSKAIQRFITAASPVDSVRSRSWGIALPVLAPTKTTRNVRMK